MSKTRGRRVEDSNGHGPIPEARTDLSTVLRARRIGIETNLDPVVFLRYDSHVCKSEGFQLQSRVEVSSGERRILATLHIVTSDILAHGHIGLSDTAWRNLGVREGDLIRLAHPKAVQSFSRVRSKIYGGRFSETDAKAIIDDVVEGNYSDLELASFVTACAGDHLDLDEVIAMTRAMVDAGSRLVWDRQPVVDKHCVGGLPGNRTT